MYRDKLLFDCEQNRELESEHGRNNISDISRVRYDVIFKTPGPKNNPNRNKLAVEVSQVQALSVSGAD